MYDARFLIVPVVLALIWLGLAILARLRLIPPSVDCEVAYERFYTDGIASAGYGGPISRGAAWARLAADLGSWYLQGFGVWAVQRKIEGDVVGSCGFWQAKDWPRELTWWMIPEVRGQSPAMATQRTR